MKKQQTIIFFVVMLIMLIVPNVSNATTGDKDVPAKFGSISLPKNTYIIEYDFTGSKVGETEDILKDITKFFNLYQIAMDDGNIYQNAVLATVLLDNKSLKEQTGIKGFKLTPKQKIDMLNLQTNIKLYAELMVADYNKNYSDMQKVHKISFDEKENTYQNSFGLVMFEWSDIENIQINGQEGYKTDLRAVFNSSGIMRDIYIKAYVFNIENKGLGMILVGSVDSERVFWAEKLDNCVEKGLKFF